MSANTRPSKSTRVTAAKSERRETFTAEERRAMQDRAAERKAEARGARGSKGDAEGDVLAKIAAMPEPDRAMAARVHAVVRSSAPALTARLWYGMPAYAKAGKVVCFFQGAQKFKTRYSSFGFSDAANLDDGAMWPVAFALKDLTSAEEARIAALVKRAAH